MATERADKPTSSLEERREALTCSLCMDIFRCPKLLPCSHTFCKTCLDKLMAHYPSPIFPCPSCRRGICKPTGDASTFQTNFYIHPEDLERARHGTQCLSHPNQDVDLFCVTCLMPVCLKCKLTKHDGHKTQDLIEAYRATFSQLRQDQEHLHQAVAVMMESVESARKDRREQCEMRTAIESIIRKHHGTLVAAAEKFLVEALATLKTASEVVEDKLNKDVSAKEDTLEDLCQLQEELREAQKKQDKHKILAAVREMREGRGSPEVLNNIMSPENKEDSCRSELQPDFILSHFRQFLGTVSTVESELNACSSITIDKGVIRMRHIRVTVSVEKQFVCGNSSDAEVFALCPLNDGNVCVSYVKHGGNKNAPSEKYDSTGKLLCRQGKMPGKVSFKRVGEGKFRILPPVGDLSRAYSKSGSTVHFKLNHSVDGKAEITRINVLMEEPFNAELTHEFSINVGPHRAFDVDGEEQLFVVVEEPQPPETQRKVKMYRRKEQDPIATYVPPSPTCQPSDVCFCRLGGQAVLIADELGDSIHVVDVNDGAMSFLRYLAPGCPSLVQPTALNTDTKGRLWVACRGGLILAMSPVTWSDPS